MRDDDVWKLVVPGAFLVVLLIAIGTGSCTDENGARRTLEGQGFTDIQLHGQNFFACGQDPFSTRFSAVNPKGRRVMGTVCCGVVKDCTVRF